MTSHDDSHDIRDETRDVRVAIASSGDVVEARQQGRALAATLGFTPSEATLMAAAISELARNIVKYAGEGEIIMRSGHDGMMYVTARDRGPGIPDMQLALRPGYSTSGGLGLGLAGVRRIADHFELNSSPNGTTVTLGKRRR
jgi:serine/threonine-protein kinase RsbT